MRILVVGTGTDVGKSHVTCALLHYLRRAAISAAAYKPIATGVSDRCDDAEAHAAALGRQAVAPSYSYRRPVSPHLAAREEQRPIALATIADRASELQRDVAWLLIESAGGLCSPVAEERYNFDLVKGLLPAKVLLVAPDRIGVLHDVVATLLAASAMATPIDAIVLSAAQTSDDSTGSNADELRRLSAVKVPVVGSFPRQPPDGAASQELAAALLAVLAAPVAVSRRP